MASKYYEAFVRSVSRPQDESKPSYVFNSYTKTFKTLDEVREYLNNEYSNNVSKQYTYIDDKKGRAKQVGVCYSWEEKGEDGIPYIWEDWIDVREIKATKISPESWGEVNDVEVDL